MKMICLLFCVYLFPFALFSEELPVLDKELDERIELNKKYKTDFTEDAKESDLAHELVPLQSRNGQDWVDFLTYVRKSEDIQLKVYVLRIELQTELIGYYYDLEYAESFAEKSEIFKEIEKYKAKLAAVKAFAEGLKKPEPVSAP